MKIKVGTYELETDRLYDRETHLWFRKTEEGRYHCGLDPLGSETSGDIVAIAFEPVGTGVSQGGSFGSLEAAKFVGPLTLPVAGRIVAHNEYVLEDPGCIQKAPFDHWLIEIEVADEASLSDLLGGADSIRAWFSEEVERFHSQGALAE